MHIVNPQSGLLSNHELLLHLQAQEAEYTGTDKTNRKRAKPKGLEHVLRDGLAYLENKEYMLPALANAHPNRPMTLYKGPHSLFRALAPKYRLNKSEYLQIYNLRPKTLVSLDLVIEEAGSRFTEHQMNDMLEIIQRIFEEEEASIPAGAEHQEMERLPSKMLGASKKRRRFKKKA